MSEKEEVQKDQSCAAGDAKKNTQCCGTGKKVSVDDVLATIEQMTIVELNELVKTLEDKFGITAAAPVAVASLPVGASGGDVASPAEEKTEFSLILTDSGASKINVIKVVRKYNSALGLKEAKELVESTPATLFESIKKEEAEAIKKEFEEAGAKVELK